jgi:hypothetical protein
VIPELGLVPEKLNQETLFQLYRVAIEEYRFQVTLNWQRSQYYFVLNAALIAAGGSLFGIQGDRGRPFAAILFLMGLVAVLLAMLVTKTQHLYYREARDKLKQLQQRLGLGEFGISTTPSMGSRYERIATVKAFNTIMFSLLGVVDLAGIVATWEHFSAAVRNWFS